MGKVAIEPQYLSQQEFDTKLDTEIGNLIDKGFSDDDILLYTEDFKSRFAIKKKDNQEPNLELPSETGSLVYQKPKYPKIDTGSADKFQELINKAPLGVGGVESNAFKEWESIRNEYLSRPPMQADNTDLLRRLEGLQPAPKSALDQQVNTVRELRTKMEEKKLRADVIARATGKSRQEILDGDQGYKQLEKAEVNLKGNDFSSVFGSNLLNASAGIAGTPNAIIESLGKLFVSDEEYAKIPEGMRNTFFTDILQTMPLPNMQAIARTAESGRERQIDLLDESKKLRELSTQYDTAITQDVNILGDESNLAQAGKRLAVEGVGSIPSLVQAIIPYVGLSSIVTGTAANRLEENKLDGDLTNRDVADAWINGAAEGALEAVTRGLAKKAFNAFGNAGEESAKTLAKSIVDNLVYSPLKEGGSEAATSLVQNLSDAFVLGNEVDVKDAMYEIFDSFLIGGVVGGGLGSVTTLGEAINTNRKAIEGDKEAQQQLENKPKFEGEMVELNIPAVEEPVTTTEQPQTAVEQQTEAPQQQTTVSEETMAFAEELGTPEDISDVVNGGVSIPIGNTNVVLKSEGENIKIESIQTPSDQRGQGSARQAIRRVTEIADQQGKTLELNVLPMDENTDAQQLVDFYEREGFVKDEGFTLDGGRMTRQPNLQDNSLNLQDETTAEQVSEPVPQGEDRGAIEGNRRMEELTQRFEQNIAASETLGEEGRTNGERILPKQEINDREARESVDWAKENNIWYNDVTDFGNRYSEGVENTVSIDPENNYVYKQNNLIYSGNSISTLFSQVEAFNEVFPSTAYEFVGFSGVDSSNPNRPPTAQPIFRQPLINNADLASPQEIKTYMESLGFEQINETTFSNGTYEVSDLFPRNVLKSQNGETFVVDAIVKRTEQAETTTQEQPITNVDIKTPYGLDRAISYLESLENDLDNFGRETLGMNMPVAIAKAAITTMKASLQTVNSMAEAIKAGVDYIKSTDWYKNLNDTDKSNVQDFFEREVLKVPKQEPQPRQTQPFQQREGKKSVFNRIYDGDTDQSLKDAVERNGLDYRIESQEKAQAAAKKFVKNVGVNKALKAVRRNEIKGAEKAFVYAEILDAVANASEGASIEQMSKIQDDYSDITEEALLAFDEEARDAGRFISALNKVYNTSKIKYALTKQVNDYKAANNGFIDDETLAKFKEADKKIRELEDKIDKLEAKRQKEEGEQVINDIKEGEQRKKKKGFTKAEAKRVANNIRKAKIHKPGIFSSATPASLVWDGAIETVAKAVEAGGTLAEAIQKGISFIKKSDWYKSLSNANKELAEKEFRNNILDTQEEMSVTINDDGSLRISEQTLRTLVEGGIDNIDELAQAVLDIIKQTDPNTEFTVREVRDAITKYGKQINPSKDEINKKIAELKRVGRLMSALEDVVGGRKPKRSGFQRPKPTQTERELMRQVNDAMRDLPMDETEINEAWKTALDRTKTRLQNQIEDLEKQIANKEKRKATREPIKLDEAALELQNKRDALREELDNLVGKPELTEKQKIKRAEAYLQKQVDKLANQIADRDLAFRERQEGVTSQEIERLKNERKSLQEELTKLRNEEGIIERRRLKQAKERLQNQINDYQRRLREGDFSKKETRPVEADKELTELQAEKIKWQEVFEKERYALELKNRTKIEYAKDLVVGILNIPRILMAGGEMSMVLIQGGIQTISLATRNPKALVQTFGKAFMAVGSQRKMDEYASKLKADPNYNLMRQHKLALTEADYKMELREEEFIGNNLVYGIWNYIGKGIEYGSYKLTGVRDMPSIGSSLLSLIKKDVEKNRIPISERIKNMNPLLAFERGNTVYMNEMRRLRFLDGMKKIQMEGKNENDHPQDFRNLARTINTLTGRAEINWKVGKKHLSLESVNDVIGTVFFSFKNTVSVFNQLNPFWYVAQHSPNDPITKPSVAQKIAVRDMLSFVATTTSMMYLLQAAAGNDEDDEPMIDIESDPRSSDFMQLKLKGRSKYIRFDPWHGMRTQVVFFARLFSGEQKTSKGEIKRIGQGYKADTQWDIFTRTYIENKFSPSAAMFYKYMDSEIQEVEGEEMRVRFGEPLSETYKESFYPMYINAVKEIQEEDPNLITSYLTALSFFGLNTGVYGDINDTKYDKKRMTKEEAEKIRLRNARKREQQRRDQTP